MYDPELGSAIRMHLAKEDAALRRLPICKECGEHIQDDKALRCSDEELICPSCAEDLAVDEEDTPSYACSVCGDTQSERRYFFEGEYYCGNHFEQLFVNVEPDD